MNDELDINDREVNCMLIHLTINDYLGYEPGREEYEDSRIWLFSEFDETETDRIENNKNGFISLYMACDLLGLDCDRLRIIIKLFEDQQKRRIVDSQFDELLRICRKK